MHLILSIKINPTDSKKELCCCDENLESVYFPHIPLPNSRYICILPCHAFAVYLEYLSSPIKDVKADCRLLAAILGYRKEDIGFISEVIRVHNKYRKIHGCRDLSQCARLRQQAGMYAQELANQGVRELQNNPKLEFGIGENIYISCGNEVSGEEAVNHWYNEACNYFTSKKSYNEYKHFAQVVWKATYLIGVGRRTSTKSGQKCTYVVTRYRPGAEQGPAESANIPKGNFDSSICSGNSGGTGANIQASGGFASQTGGRGTSESATNSGQSMQGRPAQGNAVPQPSESAQLAGSSNAGSPARGASNSAQSTQSMPAAGKPVSQSESSQPARLPTNSQPAGYSTPAGSMGTETSEGGGVVGNNGITESNSVPSVTPTSVPGTGDRERASNPENSHISPLIEQQETGSQGSQGTGGQQVSPTSTPYCPPCPGTDIQTESFETSGGAERLPESGNNPRSDREEEQSSSNSNPDQLASSTNSGNPSDQTNPANPDKPAEQVDSVDSTNPGKPVDQTNTANPDKPAEQVNSGKTVEPVNPVDKANPDEQGKPAEQTNPAKPDNPVVSSGSEKQCPACSCPKKQGSENPQGSKGSQQQTSEGSKSSPGGNEVSHGQPSGKEVSQGQSSESNNTPTNEVKPSSEGRPGGNVASSESAGVSGKTTLSENPPASQGGREGGEGKPASQGAIEGNTGSGTSEPSVNQPTRENQSAETGNPSRPSEGTGVTSGGSEGTIGISSEGTGGSQGSSSGGSEGSQGTENTETTEGSRTGSEGTGDTGDKGTGGVEGGQTEATQGAGGQGGGVSGGIPEGGAFIENLDVFQQSALEAHNKYRQFHNSPPLVQNSEMSSQATEFAQKLAKSSINDAEHSQKSSRENQGENVYVGCQTNPSGADVTKEWYKELCNYDYNKQAKIDAKEPIGHFTQVIWKSSTEFGIGRAYGSDQNCVYIVARYKPAGNVLGSESANIARGTMDGEYCGSEFMAINKPENGKKEGLSPGGQPDGASKVETEQPNQNTNEGSQQESSNASEGKEQNTNEANPSEGNNVSQGNQQNSENSNTGESNQSETSTNESNQQNTNTGETNLPESTSNGSEGGRQQTEGRNEQARTNTSSERDGSKRIPFLPGYLQKSALENTNKRYRGLRTE
ncbi:PRY1-like isoform X1 [Paramuricea clavata]|uniref:PRY1-like isoform X1 n=1 Tax=Paramuricea clavata TaxID=317549 RepID=A0A7D9DUQ4_PARCT|nr:PRY1-like isoform X1 [Paramuricea clavata]